MSKRRKICFGLLLACSIIFGLSLNASSDVSAASLGTSSFDLYYTPSASLYNYAWRNNILYGNSSPTIIDSDGGISRYQINTASVTAGGNYASIHFETNIVATRYDTNRSFNPWVNLPQQNIITCSASGIAVISKNLSYATTYWHNGSDDNNTLTFYGDLTLSGFNQNSSYILTCSIGSSQYSFIDPSSSVAVWFEQNPMSISWYNDQSAALLQTQTNQNNVMISQNEYIISQNDTYYNNEYQGEQNISNQSSSDIQGAENQQTTNIIGTISSFVTALGTVQTGSCELTLPFPDYAGGSVQANPCSYKDKAPTIVTIGSSLLLIGIFIPLAFVVLKMIYNEIRSWTNG